VYEHDVASGFWEESGDVTCLQFVNQLDLASNLRPGYVGVAGNKDALLVNFTIRYRKFTGSPEAILSGGSLHN
jgi:hypothetical protein